MTIFDKLIKKLFNIENENKSKKSDGKYENSIKQFELYLKDFKAESILKMIEINSMIIKLIYLRKKI